MSEQPTPTAFESTKPPPPTRAQRLAAFGFLGAFGLTILTVLLTGLSVGAPSARHVLHSAPPVAETGLPSPQTEKPSTSSEAAPPANASEPRTSKNAAGADADGDRDDGTRKDVRKDASRAHDAPGDAR